MPFPAKFKTDNNGSALLVTLMVVSLLMIMVLTFVTMVRMELRSVITHQEKMQARASARLGAEMAIANLQELAGPDRRVTARGDLFDGSVDNLWAPGGALPSGMGKWVGVWDSASFDEHDPTAKRFLGWLVSSGDPGELLPFNATPIDPGDEDAERLVGSHTAPVPIHTRRVHWDAGRKGYAWWVDDHGVKAHLSGGRDTGEPPEGGGIIPSSLALNRVPPLEEDLAGTGRHMLQRLTSFRELPFFGLDETVAPEVYFDFTLRSTGVLADVKNGGLKKDLTLAFENDTVFERVFPRDEPGRYLLLDPDKLAATDDLRDNGYIHWNIFKDYYNIKRHIFRQNGSEVIDGHYFAKENLVRNVDGDPLALGIMAPHDMGPSNPDMPDRHREQPYGDLLVITGDDHETPAYKHNVIGPILAFMQQTAWLEYTPETTEEAAKLTARGQMWTSHYNPYNIGLLMRGPSSNPGVFRSIRILNYPQIYFHIPGVSDGNYDRIPGEVVFTNRRESNAEDQPVLAPGTSQVYGLEFEAESDEMRDAGPYGPNIRDTIGFSVYNRRDLSAPLVGEQDVTVTFRFERGGSSIFAHGVNMHPPRVPPGESESHDMELTQVIYSPYSWDEQDGYPAKIISDRLLPVEFENRKFSVGFFLRTTRETPDSGAYRPLVDANIRAPWVNPRWDSPLDLSTPAGYSSMNRGEAEDEFPLMQTRGDGRGFSYLGGGRGPSRGSPEQVLFDIPRQDLVSLGQLQHAGAGRFSYEPSYIVANSYLNPRIPSDQWRNSIRDTFSTRHDLRHNISSNFNLYDASYLVNQRLWDGFAFTTIPQVRDNHTPGEPEIDYEALYSREVSLPNPRHLPYTPEGSAFEASVVQMEGDSGGTFGGFHHNAGHVLVDGAFNVNSTSVAAWEAFLSGTLELPVRRVNTEGEITGFDPVGAERVRFPRVSASLGEGMETDSINENYWTGFRELGRDEVREIADGMVEQVKRRGPFLNMGEFVNRMLRNGPEGEAGALQTVLDATVNRDLSSNFEREAGASPGDATQGAGFPGQLLQGDVLQALAPMMQVRSDTFTIRAYGEIGRRPGGAPRARAWCEVEVQRLPDPVVSGETPTGDAYWRNLSQPESPFGRQFRIVSFRWLNEDEI